VLLSLIVDGFQTTWIFEMNFISLLMN